MKLQKLSCPNCDALMNIKLDDEKRVIFCPYCGQQFRIESKENINININKKIRKVDDAAIIKAKSEAKETKYMYIFIIVMYSLILGGFGAAYVWDKLDAKNAMQSGKVSIGNSWDYEGEHYKKVVAQLESFGFVNIEIIDLDDASTFNKENTVESISINGIERFDKDDYFYTTDKILVIYH